MKTNVASACAPHKEWVAYARYSTDCQHSIEDQVHACREFAATNGAAIPDENIYRDAGFTGKMSRRPGLIALKEKLASGTVGVLVTLTSSRLHRKAYKASQFIEEDVLEHGVRCVCIRSGVDTAHPQWRLVHGAQAMADEVVLDATANHVREAHRGMLRAGRVCGTISFGYRAMSIDVGMTRKGKPASRYAIDPSTSKWVVQIFDWFVKDRLSLAEIARRLRAQAVPAPPKSGIGWAFRSVRLALTNARYTGVWSYGTRMTVWKNRADYGRQVQRDKPLETIHNEELRIIPDDIFEAAQRELATRDRSGGRPPKGRQPRARILNGLLYCGKHDRPLIVGNGFFCPDCRWTEDADRLVSCATPELAVQLICGRLAKAIAADARLVADLPQAMAKAVEQMQRPDPQQLTDAEVRKRKLNFKKDHVLDDLAERPEDQDDRRRLREVNRQLADVDGEIVQLREAMAKVAQVPDVAELAHTVGDIREVLVAAAHGDPREQQTLRNVISQLTGGRIVCTQGTKGSVGKACLNASFGVDLLAAVIHLPSGPGDASQSMCVALREPTWAEVHADEVKAMVDQGRLLVEIAEHFRVRKNVAGDAYHCWFTSRGMVPPDGRHRVKTLSRKRREPLKHVKLSDQVWEKMHTGKLLSEIADELGVGRDQITAASRYAYEQRGLPVSDGRSRRKGLSKKNRFNRRGRAAKQPMVSAA